MSHPASREQCWHWQAPSEWLRCCGQPETWKLRARMLGRTRTRALIIQVGGPSWTTWTRENWVWNPILVMFIILPVASCQWCPNLSLRTWSGVRRGYGWGAGGGTCTREQQYYDRPEDTNIGRVISLGHRPSHRWHSDEWLAPAVAGSVDSLMYQQISSSSYLHPIFSVWFSERFLSSSQH